MVLPTPQSRDRGPLITSYPSWGHQPGTWRGFSILSFKHGPPQHPHPRTCEQHRRLWPLWWRDEHYLLLTLHSCICLFTPRAEDHAAPALRQAWRQTSGWVSTCIRVVSPSRQDLTHHTEVGGKEKSPATLRRAELRHCKCTRWGSTDPACEIPQKINRGWRLLPSDIAFTVPEPNACLHLCFRLQSVGSAGQWAPPGSVRPQEPGLCCDTVTWRPVSSGFTVVPSCIRLTSV